MFSRLSLTSGPGIKTRRGGRMRRCSVSGRRCSSGFVSLWSTQIQEEDKSDCTATWKVQPHELTIKLVFDTHACVIILTVIIYCMSVCVLSADAAAWDRGVLYAEGQNLARFLMEAPANHITPTAFANTIEEKLAPHAECVTVKKRFVLYSS